MHGVDARQFVQTVIHPDERAESRRELGDHGFPAFVRATHAEMADRFVQPGFVNLDDHQGATTSGASVSRRVVSLSLDHKSSTESLRKMDFSRADVCRGCFNDV
jgi:hypothetical protein